MELQNIEIGANIKFTDEDGVHTFVEGDNVICIVGDERYTGVISGIGNYKDSEDEEAWRAMCLNTSDKKNTRTFSSEIIKIDDITYICKNFLADDVKEERTQEEIEKNTFVTMISGLGYDKTGVEKAYEAIKKVKDQFDIPMDKMIACSIYSLQNHCSIEVPLKDMCGIDVEYMEGLIEPFEKATLFSIGMVLTYFTSLLSDFVDTFTPDKKQK